MVVAALIAIGAVGYFLFPNIASDAPIVWTTRLSSYDGVRHFDQDAVYCAANVSATWGSENRLSRYDRISGARIWNREKKTDARVWYFERCHVFHGDDSQSIARMEGRVGRQRSMDWPQLPARKRLCRSFPRGGCFTVWRQAPEGFCGVIESFMISAIRCTMERSCFLRSAKDCSASIRARCSWHALHASSVVSSGPLYESSLA